MIDLKDAIVELYRKCATELPEDVVTALSIAKESEEDSASNILSTILDNIKLAKEKRLPICQDTGTPIFYVYAPFGVSHLELKNTILEATKEATETIPLRPNAVETLTNKNSGNNIGINFPIIHFEEWEDKFIKINLMLKGGGSENIGTQYQLPDTSLNANRDIEGVKKCVIDAMYKAQGRGCSPNIAGVAIGGSKDSTLELSKSLFFRKLDDNNENETLAEAEKDLHKKLNSLNIGPMGLGGKTTVLGVKLATQHRHPASYFVGVSFMCWACRRYSLRFKDGEATYD